MFVSYTSYEIGLFLQKFWETGQRVVFTEWLRYKPKVTLAYSSEVKRKPREYFDNIVWTHEDDLTEKFSHNFIPNHLQAKGFSSDAIIQNMESLAQMYMNRSLSWENIVSEMNILQPNPLFKCTMAIINPFTSKLEWITVSCETKYNISTIVCQKQVLNNYYRFELKYYPCNSQAISMYI